MLHVCLLLSCFAADPAEDASKKDREALQGKWKIVSLWIDGVEYDADKVTGANATVEFTGDEMKFTGLGAVVKASFTLGGDDKLKTIDTKDEQGRIEKGIYELDGKKLRMCVARTKGKRPTKFESTEKPATSLFVLERVEE